MNYMLLVYSQEECLDQFKNGCEGLSEQLAVDGKLLAGGILERTPAATSVRLREGRRIVTDGPFAETHEQLAGYMLIQAENLDDAIAIAAQHPVARVGTIEVRPLRVTVGGTDGVEIKAS